MIWWPEHSMILFSSSTMQHPWVSTKLLRLGARTPTWWSSLPPLIFGVLSMPLITNTLHCYPIKYYSQKLIQCLIVSIVKTKMRKYISLQYHCGLTLSILYCTTESSTFPCFEIFCPNFTSLLGKKIRKKTTVTKCLNPPMIVMFPTEWGALRSGQCPYVHIFTVVQVPPPPSYTSLPFFIIL